MLTCPLVPPHVLDRQIFEAIDEALSEIGNQGPFDKDAWQDVFAEIVRPLFSSMRDVRRYAMAIPGTVRELDGNVALVDVLALEAVRVFLPDVFCQMHQGIDGLITVSEFLPGSLAELTRLKQQIEGLISAARRCPRRCCAGTDPAAFPSWSTAYRRLPFWA